MKEWEKLEPIYNMNLQAHTRNQVQMYMTGKIIAEKLVAKVRNSKVSTTQFLYDTFYFATLDNEPITLERFVDSEFTKHVNNDGNPCQKVLGKSSLFKQAEALLVCIFPMKQATRSFCWLIYKWRIINYTIQGLQL